MTKNSNFANFGEFFVLPGMSQCCSSLTFHKYVQVKLIEVSSQRKTLYLKCKNRPEMTVQAFFANKLCVKFKLCFKYKYVLNLNLMIFWLFPLRIIQLLTRLNHSKLKVCFRSMNVNNYCVVSHYIVIQLNLPCTLLVIGSLTYSVKRIDSLKQALTLCSDDGTLHLGQIIGTSYGSIHCKILSHHKRFWIDWPIKNINLMTI